MSELGLGTQRWMGDDFNSPNRELCFKLLDTAVLDSGISLIDTAEQYPIPSSQTRPQGDTERVIGDWIKQAGSSVAQRAARREKLVIASKITGGRNVNKYNIEADLEGSLRRLGTDYLDLYLLHWPARYQPQANWGQSLQYRHEMEQYYTRNAQFEEICLAMGDMIAKAEHPTKTHFYSKFGITPTRTSPSNPCAFICQQCSEYCGCRYAVLQLQRNVCTRNSAPRQHWLGRNCHQNVRYRQTHRKACTCAASGRRGKDANRCVQH